MTDEHSEATEDVFDEGEHEDLELIEGVDSERQDREASLHTYEILTYPADYSTLR